jgi:RNA polymerase sigma-70 factor (ECF subfamily)
METAPVPFDRLLAHREWVRRVARALVIDESRAADLEQQVWLAALEHPPREARSLRAWLGTVLRNSAAKMRRSEERRGRREEAAPPRLAPPGPEELVAEAEAHERVVREVLALEEPYRSTVLLRYFEDLSASDVAVRMGVPPETVRTRLRRALEQVRDRLDREHHGDRRAWCLLLLPLARRAGEPSRSTPNAAPVAAGLLGGILMGTAAKLAAAAAVAGIAGLLLWTRPWEGAPAVPLAGPAAPAGTHAPPPAPPRPEEAHAPAPVPPAAAATPGAVQARVEVVGTDRRPVAGAVIRAEDPSVATRGSSTAWPFSAAEAPKPRTCVAETRTDGAGFATVAVPRAGSWWLHVEAEGFAPGFCRPWLREDMEAPVRVILRRGYALEGLVRDAAGRPLPGAVVALEPDRAGREQRSASPTGSDGRYRMTGLADGSFRTRVRTAQGIVHSGDTLRIPGVDRYDIRIGGGVTVKGRVVDDATGLPLEGASVAAEVTTGGRVFAGMGVATTGPDGAFQLVDLPPGDQGIRISARKDGYRQSPPWDQREPTFRGAVASGTLWEKEVRLQAGVDVSPFPAPRPEAPGGEPGSVDGVVLDPAGAPAAGASVSCWSSARPQGPPQVADSDAAGRFRFENVPAGSGSLYARPRGRGLGGSLVFKLESRQGVRDLTIRMKSPASVTGRVRRSDGAAATGTSLWFANGTFAGTAKKNLPFLASDDRLVVVEEDGSFRIDDLSSGMVLLMAAAEGCPMTAPEPLEIVEGQNIEGVEVVLEPGLVIAGCIVDEAGSPVAGARITVEGLATSAVLAAVTRTEGTFRLEGLPAQNYGISVEADGYSTARAETSAGAADLRIALERVLAIRGRVVEEGTGLPLGGVPVTARPDNRTDGRPTPRGNWATTTAADGTFRLDRIVDGTWTVIAGRGSTGESSDVVPGTAKGIRPGDDAVEIAVRRGLRIEGRFVDESGTACGKPRLVRASRRGADGRRQELGGEARSNADGTFSLGGLEPPAPFDLSIRAGAGMGDETPPPLLVEGVTPGSGPVVVPVRRGVRIRGRFGNLPAEGMPEKGAYVLVRGSGEDHWPGMGMHPKKDGTFESEPLDPGRTYDLLVRGIPGRMGALRDVRPGTEEVVVELTGGLSLSGKVVDEDGVPVPAGIPVSAWAWRAAPDEPGARSSATTAADGTFTLTALGEFRFGIAVGGGGSEFLGGNLGSTFEEALAPGTGNIVLRVRRGAVLRGRLVDAAGKPAKGLLVEGLGGSGPKAYTADDGGFTLKGFEKGEVKLRVGDRTLGPFTAPSDDLVVTLPDR